VTKEEDRKALRRSIDISKIDQLGHGNTLRDLGINKISIMDLLRSGSLKVKEDGTLYWAIRGPDGSTYSWDTVASDIVLLYSYALKRDKFNRVEYGAMGTGDGLEDESFVIEISTHTLAGGALANSPILTAGAGKKVQAAWIIAAWDVAPAASYAMVFHEEDVAAAATDPHLVLTPTMNGNTKIWLYKATTVSADKDLLVDISGGAGVEVLRIVCCGCQI
jgi:hypothetical protein